MSTSTGADIKIETEDGMTRLQKYGKRLLSLILTPEGTMIGNRDFGLSFDMISMPPHQAANLLAMELDKKVPVFIPEIQVNSVDWSISGTTGRVTFRIKIGKANS